MELTDEQLDEIVNEELVEKDITQKDSIDKERVDAQLGGMGFVWERVNEKLKDDGVCFKCKKDVDVSGGQLHVREATKVEKGVVAFVGLCDDCIPKEKVNEDVDKM